MSGNGLSNKEAVAAVLYQALLAELTMTIALKDRYQPKGTTDLKVGKGN
ncbi:hypothetical protein GCM10023189_06930 [Nibrella saemangeumensis]|uniref:Uncharacterized protein n=1 Tax=Nibrella saemangeumensis TaxID=1084526 RepID=A0ABP8MD63_9BACT